MKWNANKSHAAMEYISEQALRTVFSAVAIMFIANVMMDAVFSSDSDDEEVNQPPHRDRRFGQRAFIARPNQFPRKDYNFNQFAEMLRTNSHLNSLHRDSRDFRDFFRVPALFFEEIFVWFQDRNLRKPADCVGRPGFIAHACLFSDVVEAFLQPLTSSSRCLCASSCWVTVCRRLLLLQ
jgi:hypothetical protein